MLRKYLEDEMYDDILCRSSEIPEAIDAAVVEDSR
jgi:hypothetical protein